MNSKLQEHIIRVTFYVRNCRPILLLIDKTVDNIEAVLSQLWQKLGLDSLPDHRLYLQTGAAIEDLSLLMHNDRVLVQTQKPFPKISQKYSKQAKKQRFHYYPKIKFGSYINTSEISNGSRTYYNNESLIHKESVLPNTEIWNHFKTWKSSYDNTIKVYWSFRYYVQSRIYDISKTIECLQWLSSNEGFNAIVLGGVQQNERGDIKLTLRCQHHLTEHKCNWHMDFIKRVQDDYFVYVRWNKYKELVHNHLLW